MAKNGRTGKISNINKEAAEKTRHLFLVYSQFNGIIIIKSLDTSFVERLL